jgi:hypothetical protein
MNSLTQDWKTCTIFRQGFMYVHEALLSSEYHNGLDTSFQVLTICKAKQCDQRAALSA